MDAVSAFLDMGGYGRFVWPAFGATAVVMVGLLVTSVRSLLVKERALAALQANLGRNDEGHRHEA